MGQIFLERQYLISAPLLGGAAPPKMLKIVFFLRFWDKDILEETIWMELKNIRANWAELG